MNNKRLGTAFEKKLCAWLCHRGWWVHFLSPDHTGSQPFDVIAVKDGKALAIDCKTSAKPIFNISRLEDNQVMAFEKWIACGNEMPLLAVEYNEKIYLIRYDELKQKNVDLRIRKGYEYEQ